MFLYSLNFSWKRVPLFYFKNEGISTMNLLKNTKAILLGLILTSNAFAYLGIQDFETTRMKSLAGAGIGSFLLNEAPLLNPASIGFMRKSSIYYQKDQDKLEDRSDQRNSDFKKANNELFIITDTSSGLPGGVSYQYQNTAAGKRTRYSLAGTRPITKKTTIGFILNHTEEESYLVDKSYTHLNFGLIHVINDNLSFGLILKDPTQVVAEYFEYGTGIHYKLNDFFSVIADIGSGDVENYSNHSYNKVAIQMHTMKRWYLRYGQFYNQMTNLKGYGAGISWVGPKFSIDYAQKLSEQISSKSDIIFEDETIMEYSVALTILL